MKTIYKVKVTIKIGEIKSSAYEVIDIFDNGVNDEKEIEILYETLADYMKSRNDSKGRLSPLEGHS